MKLQSPRKPSSKSKKQSLRQSPQKCIGQLDARAKKDFPPDSPTRRPHGRGASPLSARFGPQPRGRRKVARPFVPGSLVEAELRSRRARGKWAMDLPAHARRIARVLREESLRSGVRLVSARNGGSSLVLRVRCRERADLAQFLRAVAGRVPRVVTGSRKGSPIPGAAGDRERKFWDGLATTRLES